MRTEKCNPKRLAKSSPCLVCGQIAAENWFFQAHVKGVEHYLCSPDCALAFFDTHEPPPHDHAARHEYNRVRKNVVQAALSIMAHRYEETSEAGVNYSTLWQPA